MLAVMMRDTTQCRRISHHLVQAHFPPPSTGAFPATRNRRISRHPAQAHFLPPSTGAFPAAQHRHVSRRLAQAHFPLAPPGTGVSTVSPMHQHSVLFELKVGVSGDEATLFISDLLRMYGHVRESHGWQVEVISKEETKDGKGMKNSVLEVKGKGTYNALRWESGVHRVQQVPET